MTHITKRAFYIIFTLFICMAHTTMPLMRRSRQHTTPLPTPAPIIIANNYKEQSSWNLLRPVSSVFDTLKKYMGLWWKASTEAKVIGGFAALTAGTLLKRVGTAALDAHDKATGGQPGPTATTTTTSTTN